MSRHSWRLGLLAGGILAAAGTAAASSFSLAPIRLEMDAGHSAGVVTLHNEGDAPVTVQVQPVAWSQDGKDDHYEKTGELIVTPPVFVVPPNGDRIVRVARRVGPDQSDERTYRLFFQEVPEAAPAGFTGLSVALRVGIPVFMTPKGAKPDLTFSSRWQSSGELEIEATNHGHAHIQVTDFEVTGPDATVIARAAGSRYVLPGAVMHWTVKPLAGTAKPAALRLSGHSDAGDIAADVAPAAP
jgi:fimbrial chaperone protein